MKISSDELFVANKKLRRESESLKGVNENLADILNSMNLNVVQRLKIILIPLNI
jgi:hypothetical protein